jgi:iron complex outermembrane receptor protein
MRVKHLADLRSCKAAHATLAALRQITKARRGAVRASRTKVIIARGLIVMLTSFIPCSMGLARQHADQRKDLTSLSVDELMNVEVTSVSKKEEKLFQTAAAIYVITQEDIRRSGMTSVPELLRMVPGLDVARIDGTKYAISARGFNGRIANKLLVLIDGRSIYSAETSGVYWEVQDLMLEDIERIEVIRGPGGTIWGANAVNGVVNIITRRARDTQGGLIAIGGGTEDKGVGGTRYGGKIGEKVAYRVYGKYFNRRGLVDGSGRDTNDSQNAFRGGGRVDWSLTDRDSLTLEGDIYHSHLRENPVAISLLAPSAPTINRPGDFSGGNLLGRWTRAFSERSDMSLQVYYDRFKRDIFQIGGRIDTFDLDFHHHVRIGTRQDIVWGLGCRLVTQASNDSSAVPSRFIPPKESTRLFSVFLQDEITLVKDRLKIVLGSKVEHLRDLVASATELSAEPSIRMLWIPQSHQTIWAAVSRAVRTPARSDTDIRSNISAFPGPDGTFNILTLFGNEHFKSETVLAYEAGYRVQPNSKLSFDATTFYNVYDRLQTFEPGAPFFEADPPPAHVIIPVVFGNLMRGRTYGAEASMNLNVTKGWRLAGSYSFLRMRLQPYAESLDSGGALATEGRSPEHQFQVHSYLRLPRNFELDASLYHVSQLTHSQVPSYARLDLRLAWRIAEGVEISAGGQNLLDGRHEEFAGTDAAILTTQVKRSAYGKVTFTF